MTATSASPPAPSPSSPAPSLRAHPPRRLGGRSRLLSVALGIGLALGIVASAAPPAEALTAVAHGVGIASPDGRWLGSYRLDDGRLGFCIDVGLAAPPGHDYSPVDDAGRSPDDRARLAYIARTWAGTGDPETAAAGQLATWAITGLGGHDLSWYARRAGDRAAAVEARAHAMLAEADGPQGASRSLSAAATVRLGDDGHGSVRVDLRADFLATGPADVPPGSRTGTVTLAGAVFADGSTTASVPVGTEAPITATGTAAELHVSARAALTGLPFGDALDVVGDGGVSQGMILARPADAAASAEADALAPSPLPFAPRVVTRTSRAVAAPGDRLADALHVSAAPATAAGAGSPATSGGWGEVRRPDGTLGPIPVTVRSRLLGPFPEQVGPERDDVPSDGPLVCEVATRVDHGPGDYTTPACTLPAGGFYTWVETISPADTAAGEGRSRVLPWTSTFGAATETTQVPHPPTLTTTIGSADMAAGCQTDVVHVSAFVGVGPIPLHVRLVGPLADRPADGTAIAVPDAPAGDALAADVQLTDDGDVVTPCIRVDAPGWYAAVLDSPGRAASDADGAAVPAFADHVVHASETFRVTPPPGTTPPPPVPPTLAMTGGVPGITLPVRVDAAQLATASLVVGALGTACIGLRRTLRRIRPRSSRWARS